MTEAQFNEIYNIYADQLLRFIKYREFSNETAEDIAQETWCVFWKKADDVNNKKAYLQSIASNIISNKIRINHSKKNINNNDAIELFCDDKKEEILLYNIIEKTLNNEDLDLFIDYAEGWTVSDLADKYNLSQTAVSRRLKIIKARLKQVLTD